MKIKPIVARNAYELAEALGLSPYDGLEIDMRCQMNAKIIEAMPKSDLTQAQVAKAVGISRSCLTAILNRNRADVSIDLMIRILAVLGYRTKFSFTRARHAA